ncbi:MAG: SurA N-terminal domain-containing protein [Lachnospiraceae bacterium]|nr:SurA N-terminal domain-containing protein [Lachnospiraceae bacterium]
MSSQNTTTNSGVTGLDRRKMEAQMEAKKARRSKIFWWLVLIIFLAAVVAGVAFLKIKKDNAPFIKINGENISKAEFDYHRAIEKASFLNENSYYFSMFGLDMSTIESQTYDGEMTFADYFDQLATQKLVRTKALKDAAKAEGYEYDTTAEYAETINNIKEMAAEQEKKYEDYLKMIYGNNATEKALEPVIKENIYALSYEAKLEKDMRPTDEAVKAYYEENKDQYDSVDYHLINISADIPTTTTDEAGNEVAYNATEEEIKAAMEEAKKQAEEKRATVATEGEEYINASMQNSYFHESLHAFLYEDGRKAGDTSVMENTPYNGYLVASFEKRYLDETPTESARVIITSSTDAQTILDEWKAGAATEESFIEILEKYDEAGSIINDGLYGGISAGSVNDEIYAWLSAPERKAGDTMAKNVEGEANYVLYYVGKTDPKWMSMIRSTLLSEAMNEHMNALMKDYLIEDLNGQLKFMALIQQGQ